MPKGALKLQVLENASTEKSTMGDNSTVTGNTIFVSQQDYVVPVCFILMTHKTKALYVTCLRRLQAVAPNFQPSRVMADYEDGFIIELNEVYSQNLHIEGCWFHFSQAVVRKAKKIGLSGAFRDYEHARKCIRCLTCLPLLPPGDISNAVTDLEALLLVSNETTDTTVQFYNN